MKGALKKTKDKVEGIVAPGAVRPLTTAERSLLKTKKMLQKVADNVTHLTKKA